MFLKLLLVVVENVKNNKLNLYDKVYISLSRTVSNFECINEEVKRNVIMECLNKAEVIEDFIKYDGKLLPLHMFVFEVKKKLLSNSLE